jgi:hypothetical protein
LPKLVAGMHEVAAADGQETRHSEKSDTEQHLCGREVALTALPSEPRVVEHHSDGKKTF